jgi:hypothetical protein
MQPVMARQPVQPLSAMKSEELEEELSSAFAAKQGGRRGMLAAAFGGLAAAAAKNQPALAAVGTLLAPHAAHAGVTPSLQNLLNSVLAGGFVAAAIAAAVVAVSSFEEVDRQ